MRVIFTKRNRKIEEFKNFAISKYKGTKEGMKEIKMQRKKGKIMSNL